MSDKELTIPLPINPSPKTLFLVNSAKVKNHNSMIGSPVLKESIDTALLEYQLRLAGNTQESNGAAAAMFKIKGALEFVDELYKLSSARQPTKSAADGQKIDHTV